MRSHLDSRRLGFGSVWLLAIVLLFPSIASAYILPARFYLSRCIRAQASIPALSIRQVTRVYRQGKLYRTYQEKLRIQRPGTIRLDRYYKGKKVRIELWKGGYHWIWKAGQGTQKKTRQLTPKYDFLALSSGSSGYGNLKSLLRMYGVATAGRSLWRRGSDYYVQKHVSLTWYGGVPQVVLGAPPNNRRKNQLWISKKSYAPSRFLGSLGSPSVKVDVRFLDYHSSFQGKLFPGRIEERLQGRLVTSTLVSGVRTLRQFSPGVLTRLPQ